MAQILLVEDDVEIGEMYSLGLRLAGHAVTVARDGEDGLQLALGLSFDLALLDLRLPKLDGLGVLAALRERDGRLPVVVLINEDGHHFQLRAWQLGVKDYLVKSETPPPKLVQLVATWLR